MCCDGLACCGVLCVKFVEAVVRLALLRVPIVNPDDGREYGQLLPLPATAYAPMQLPSSYAMPTMSHRLQVCTARVGRA